MIILLNNRQLTPKQLVAALKDVPPATLYHHLNLLTEAGLTRVVEERLVRGTLHEKVYTLADVSTTLEEKDLTTASKDDLMRYFLVFLSKLIGDFQRYLDQHESGTPMDWGVRQAPLYLSEEEFMQFLQDIAAALEPWRNNEPTPGRRLRVLTTILIPELGDETQKKP